MDGLMPGTDFGILLIEFLTMLGPEIFTAIGMYLSETDIIMNMLNNLYPGIVIVDALIAGL